MCHRRLSLATGTAVVCLVVLGGCGSTNLTAQFKAGYAADRGQLNLVFSAVNKTLTAVPRKSTAEIAGTVSVLAARFGKNLAPLEALKPPARVVTEFATLTSSLQRIESDLRGISVAAKRRSYKGAVLADEQLNSDARAARDAATAIKRKLYTT
jgi:hypothetical protein